MPIGWAGLPAKPWSAMGTTTRLPTTTPTPKSGASAAPRRVRCVPLRRREAHPLGRKRHLPIRGFHLGRDETHRRAADESRDEGVGGGGGEGGGGAPLRGPGGPP